MSYQTTSTKGIAKKLSFTPGTVDNYLSRALSLMRNMHLVYAIRTGDFVNEAEQKAYSTITAIIGRMAAYTSRLTNWDEILRSDMDLGPEFIEFGPVDLVFETPIPGTHVAI